MLNASKPKLLPSSHNKDRTDMENLPVPAPRKWDYQFEDLCWNSIKMEYGTDCFGVNGQDANARAVLAWNLARLYHYMGVYKRMLP